jgi:hypothetical protein
MNQKKLIIFMPFIEIGSVKKNLLNYMNINKLSKYVKIIDYKDNPYRYLKMSHLFILTSKFKGLPNVLLESHALKKIYNLN